MPERTDLRSDLVLSVRMLERAGLVDMNGHVSARDPDTGHVIINAHGASRHALTERDLVTIDLSGRLLDGEGSPPSEWPLHTCMYEARPDIMAVAHFHPPVATRFGVVRRPLVAVCNLGAAVGTPALYDAPDLIRNRTLGVACATALGQSRAVLMRGHGVTVVGGSVLEAFVLSLCLEENARMLAGALALGDPVPFTPEEVQQIGAMHREARVMRKFWDYQQSKLKEG